MQPNVLPGLTSVGGLVDAITRAEGRANVRLTGPGIKDVRVRRRNLQRADRGDGLPIEHRLPAHAGVDGLPHTAINRAKVKRSSAAGYAGHGCGAAAAKGADQPPLQSAEQLRSDRLAGGTDVQKKCGKNNNDGKRKTSYTMAQSEVLYPARSVRIDYTFAMRSTTGLRQQLLSGDALQVCQAGGSIMVMD